jgi:uncharacterized metal-binding protein
MEHQAIDRLRREGQDGLACHLDRGADIAWHAEAADGGRPQHGIDDYPAACRTPHRADSVAIDGAR